MQTMPSKDKVPRHYDQTSVTRTPTFRVGERVFVFMPAEKTGKNRKFARPYHGPYRVLEVTESNAKVVRVDHPDGTSIYVSPSRLRHCPEELPEGCTWPSPQEEATTRQKDEDLFGRGPVVSE